MTRARRRSKPTAVKDVSGIAETSYRAYVLVQTVPGRVESIQRALRRLPEVHTVDSVTGPYDLVAVIAVDELRELSHVVAGTIGGMRGVTRTTTLLCT